MNLSRKIFAYSYLLSAGVLLTALSSCSDDYIVNTADETRLIRFNVSAASLESSSNQTATKGTRENALALLQLHGASNPLFLVPWIEDRAEASFENVNGDITRSILVDASNMESFGVYAGYASEAGSTTYKPNYMSNIEITRASGWMPHDEYLWPGEDALHFNAYSPYFSGSATDGITGINSSSGVLSLDYVTPAEVADQKDLLYATPVEASSSPCNLSFNHALTAVRFVTGAEMAQCTIRSIAITNVESNGKLNLESGEWTDLSSTSDFSVSPEISLVAEENSNFVAPETPITSDEQTFLLIPQKLRSEAAIKILIESNGNESELTASLDSQSLPEGKIVTYRISANPESDSLILDVKGSFNSEYTGSNLSFNVKSSYNDGGVATPVNWTAEFVDDNGNVISQPYWISDFTLSGSGNTEGKISTVMQDIVFEKMSSQTRVLQDATDINSSSGHNPFNLSSSTGAANVENTANTYVINAPGSYMIPLVYGNAIKNSAENKQAFVPGTHNSRALKNFTNHLNNPITSPYIYNNSGCTPSDAVLIWEDEQNLVRNVNLSSDGKSLHFDVPQNSIRQGNALVAVRDADKNVMWSWQIWVTDYSPSDGFRNIAAGGKSYGLASSNLGYVAGGDKFIFPECSVKIRFTQTGLPEGVEPLSKTITLTQNSQEFETPDYNTYYQWGRKDPMMSGDKTFFDANHNEITERPLSSASDLSDTKVLMQLYILNPDVFYSGSHDSDENNPNYTSYPYNNFWNGAYNTSNIKTIYDPSPVGFVVPYTEPLMDFTPESKTDPTARYEFRYNPSPSDSESKGFYITVKDSGDVLFFPDLGYISGATGKTVSNGEFADYWLSHAIQTLKTGGIVQFYTTASEVAAQQTTDPLFHGMSVRAIKE